MYFLVQDVDLKALTFLVGVSENQESPIPLDGFDVWETISLGKASPRTEILLNIDEPGEVPPGPGILGGYTGVALRMGEMKLLMQVPNVTWFKPPEIGGKPDKELPLNALLELPHVVGQMTYQYISNEDNNLECLKA